MLEEEKKQNNAKQIIDKNNLKKATNQNEKVKKQKKEIEKLKKEINELKDKYIRTVAEFNNFKKRKEKEIIGIIENANTYLFLELLPVIDDFERSLNSDLQKKSYKSLHHGVELIYQKLLAVLKSQGLEPIDSIDHPFDPELHEAVMQLEDKQKDANIILEEALKGYRLRDKVIRHAKVIVNK